MWYFFEATYQFLPCLRLSPHLTLRTSPYLLPVQQQFYISAPSCQFPSTLIKLEEVQDLAMSDIDKEDSDSLQEHDTTISEGSQIENEEDYILPDGAVIKANRHEHIRAELLQAAEASYDWTHPQPQGEAPDDRTAPVAFPADQLDVSNVLHISQTCVLGMLSIWCIHENNDQMPCGWIAWYMMNSERMTAPQQYRFKI